MGRGAEQVGLLGFAKSYIFRKTPDEFCPTFIKILCSVSQNASPPSAGVNFDRGEEVSVGVNSPPSPPVSSCLVLPVLSAMLDIIYQIMGSVKTALFAYYLAKFFLCFICLRPTSTQSEESIRNFIHAPLSVCIIPQRTK